MKKSLALLFISSMSLAACSSHTHVFENGKCVECGFHEPTNKYLPSLIEEYDDTNTSIKIGTTSFEYDKDLLGYSKTEERFNEDGPTKEVTTFRYKNDDFNEYSVTTYDYGYDKPLEEYHLEYVEKVDTVIYEDGKSFMSDTYLYDDELEEFAFVGRIEEKYNSRGQIISETWFKPSDTTGEKYCYEDKYVYEYDEEGYPLGVYYYTYLNHLGDDLYLYGKDVYTYNQDKTSCREDDFYRGDSESEFELTYYALIDITKENGLIVFNSQNYTPDGDPRNINVFKYTEDWVRIYAYFSGPEEFDSYELNDNHQVIHYQYGTDPEHIRQTEDLTYSNDGLLVGCEVDDLYYTSSSSFEYNELGQIVHAESVDQEKGEEVEYKLRSEITYSNLKDGLLLEHLDFMIPLYSRYIGATVAEFKY